MTNPWANAHYLDSYQAYLDRKDARALATKRLALENRQSARAIKSSK